MRRKVRKGKNGDILPVLHTARPNRPHYLPCPSMSMAALGADFESEDTAAAASHTAKTTHECDISDFSDLSSAPLTSLRSRPLPRRAAGRQCIAGILLPLRLPLMAICPIGNAQRQETVHKPNSRKKVFAPLNESDNWENVRYRATDFRFRGSWLYDLKLFWV